MAKYLSDEYLTAVESALNGNDAFQNAAKGQGARLQQVVTGTPDGEVHYGFVIDGGKVTVSKGDIENPEATVTQDYETATKLAKGELQGQAAFMQGKLKISGNLMKMMQLQGVFTAMPGALKDVDSSTDY